MTAGLPTWYSTSELRYRDGVLEQLWECDKSWFKDGYWHTAVETEWRPLPTKEK